MVISKRSIIKIASITASLVLAFGIYYFFIKAKVDDKNLDPLSCKQDEDCTYYGFPSCYNAKPINKKYKSNVLSIGEQDDTLCGNIQTFCKNYQCEIERK